MPIGEDTVEAVLRQFIEHDQPEMVYEWMAALEKRLPDSPKITARLCEAAIQLGNKNKALHYLSRLKTQVPSNTTLSILQAHVETYFGSAELAVSIFDSVFKHQEPQYATVLLRSLAHFRAGRFLSALQFYESRISLLAKRYSPGDALLGKLWRSGQYPRKSLCIWREQGIGDELVFLRQVPLLLDHGFHIRIVTAPCLESLLRHKLQIDTVRSIQDPEALAFADKAETFIFAGSLPLMIHELLGDQITSDNHRKTAEFQRPRTPERLGIAWRTASHIGDERRAMPLELIIAVLGARWHGEIIAIQADVSDQEHEQLNGAFGNRYIGCAACAGRGESKEVLAQELSACSSVIGVSTTACFLACFLNIPTLLLLPSGADPRWRYSGSTGLLPGVTRLVEQVADNGREALCDRLAEHMRM